jgi:hypothetical protein
MKSYQLKSIQLIIFLLLSLSSVPAQKQDRAPLTPVYQRGHWGYADQKGKILIEARFDAALPFGSGLAKVGVVDEELPELDGRPNILWGYIDEKGREIVALRYNALHDFSEDLAAVAVLDPDDKRSVYTRKSLDNLRWGFVDRQGRLIILTQFANAGDFSEGLAQVSVAEPKESLCRRAGDYGYIDKSGAFIIKPQFTMAGAFKDGRARVAIGKVEYMGRCLCCAPRFVGKYGHVKRNGEFVEGATSEAFDLFPDPGDLERRR